MPNTIRLCTTTLLFFLSCIVLTKSLNAQQFNPSDSLLQVIANKEKEMFTAISNGDKLTAEKLYGEDYITINADGTMQYKKEAMETFEKFRGSTATLSGRKIRIYNNVAIINGKAKFYVKGILVAETLYTETWIYRQQHWEFIGWQGTMTGLPTWYPVIVTALLLIIFYFIIRVIVKKIRKPRK